MNNRVTSNDDCVIHVAAKANARSLVWLETGASPDLVRAWFNLSTGVIGTTFLGGVSTVALHDIIDEGNGWWRCILAGNSLGSSPFFHIGMSTVDGVTNYAGDGSSSVYLADAQYEDNRFTPSTILRNVASELTRNAEIFTVPFASPQQEFTIYVRGIDLGLSKLAGFSRLLQIGSGGAATQILDIRADASGNYESVFEQGDGTLGVVSDPGVAPTFRDEVEYLCTLKDNGKIQASISIGGAVETIGAESVAKTRLSTWATPTLYVGGTGGGLGFGYDDLVIAKGVATFDDFRAIL